MGIFIIGSGESLKNFNYEKLKDKETIAVNKVIQEIPHATYWLTADSGIASNVNSWTKGSSAKKILCYSSTHKRFHKFQNVWTQFDIVIKYGGGNHVHKLPIGFRWGEFQPGQNSGFCALQFAVIMGYSPIYLLGFDLGGGHLYDTKSRNWPRLLDEFYIYFKRGLEKLKETNIEVYSCSPISRLNNIIDYRDIKEVLCDNNQ